MGLTTKQDYPEVDHYESSNESVEEEDFMNYVPENDGDEDGG